jgi:hypothetical protein
MYGKTERNFRGKQLVSAQMKLFKAIIWLPNANAAGHRVTVQAIDLKDAKEKLEAEHGKGTVFDLHNEKDASTAR